MAIFIGRQEVPFYYSCWGYTRGNGKTWHGGQDIVGLDSTTIIMPDYKGKSISGTVITSRKVDKSTGNLTWAWGWYVCVKLDANQTPDAVNYLYFCHNDKNLVSVGQKVKTGDAIAIMGNSGNAALANPPIEHCHFEVRATSTGKGLDPTAYTGCENKVGVYGSSNSSQTTELKGIDVSKYQGSIDWSKVKSAGYDFAFIRVGYCNYDGTISEGFDPYYEVNMKNAIAAGINVGVYVYSYAKTTGAARVCANAVLDKIKPYKLTMPVAFDYEDSKTYASLGKNNNTAICKEFLQTIQNAGYYSMIYTYTSFADSYLNMSDLSAFDTWIADYRGYVGYKGSYGIWQYSSTGTVSGISGNVDMNIAYKNYPEIISGNSSGGSENLDNMYYRVKIENKCQAFTEKNVDKVLKINGSDYLPIGDYKVIEKDNDIGNQNFYWCKIQLNDGTQCYTVYNLSDGRCEIITLTKEIPVDNKSINIIIENKNQAFTSRDTNTVVKFNGTDYIPIGIYELVSMDTAPQEEGFYWCKFIYTDSKQYYAVYNLSDGRCEIIDTPEKPTPEPEPEPDPNPDIDPEKYVTIEEFQCLLNRVSSMEKEISALKWTLNQEIEDLNNFSSSVTKIEEWIKSF